MNNYFCVIASYMDFGKVGAFVKSSKRMGVTHTKTTYGQKAANIWLADKVEADTLCEEINAGRIGFNDLILSYVNVRLAA